MSVLHHEKKTSTDRKISAADPNLLLFIFVEGEEGY